MIAYLPMASTAHPESKVIILTFLPMSRALLNVELQVCELGVQSALFA
jgi:hypothetical protein